MTAMSNVLENAVLNLILINAPLSAAGINNSTLFAALFTSEVTDENTGSEVGSGIGYARTLITSFNLAVNGSSSNSSLVSFPTATYNWGTVTHFGIFDSLTGGNLLFHGPLTSPKVVNAGDSFVFPVGNITISID